MNSAVKTRWVSALRSGEYAQGHNRLHKVDKRTGESFYCCMGVLCELAVASGVIDRVDGIDVPGTTARDVVYDVTDRNYLPFKVAQWAGLASRDPAIRYAKSVTTLSWVNDQHKASFNTIADLIEERL